MQELVPPTVPVPLSVLIDDPELGLRQAAGPDGSEQTAIHTVHTSEMADPLPYLLGGELLLSAGVHCPPGPDGGEHWERYVERSVEAGAAALGFGIAPVHEEVPAQLVDACRRHGLPLVEVPRDTPFTAVARAVSQAVTRRRHQALRRLSEAQQTLATAAAGPHPVPAVLGQLAQHLDAWAVLLDRDGAELASAGTAPPGRARGELASLTGRLRPGPSSAAGTAGALHLSVYGLGGGGGGAGAGSGTGGGGKDGGAGRPFALGLCAPHRDGIDGAIAAVAVVLLALLGQQRAAVAEEQRSAALVRLMLGATPEEAAALLGGGAQRWAVVRGRRRHGQGHGYGTGTSRTAAGPEAEDPFAAAALAAGLGTTLLDVADGELRALLPVPDADAEAAAASRPGGSGLPGWTLGVSSPMPAGELGRGDAEAGRALRRALAERRPLVRQRDGEAGDVADVASLVSPEAARELARARLGPLEGRPQLVETLRMWLSLNGSWDRTAVALEVHRNTVRQRVARAGALLGMDLSDTDVRMELWFALKWRP